MERYFLEECKQRIVTQLEWEPYNNWREREFNTLSMLISEKTNTPISPNTLKRFFSKIKTSDKYLPQPATLEALAIFIGFSSWFEFEVDCKNKIRSSEDIQDIYSENKITRVRKKRKLIVGIVFLGLLFVTCFWLFVLSNKLEKFIVTPTAISSPSTITVETKFRFKPRNYSVRFNDFKSNAIDSIKITDKSSKHYHYYAQPGLYNVQISKNNKIVAENRIVLYSKGWNAAVRFPKYKRLQISTSPWLHVSNMEIAKNGFDSLLFYQTAFDIISDFNVNADSLFTISLDIKNNCAFIDSLVCNYIILTIAGHQNYFNVKLSEPKCFSFSGVSGTSGAENPELDKLGVDFRDFRNISIQKNMDSLAVLIDDAMIFKVHCKRKIGNLKCIAVNYSSYGELRNVIIKQGNTIKYSEFLTIE